MSVVTDYHHYSKFSLRAEQLDSHKGQSKASQEPHNGKSESDQQFDSKPTSSPILNQRSQPNLEPQSSSDSQPTLASQPNLESSNSTKADPNSNDSSAIKTV